MEQQKMVEQINAARQKYHSAFSSASTQAEREAARNEYERAVQAAVHGKAEAK